MLEITTGKINKPQRIGVYGMEGVGKTTFASMFPGVLFIDTEGSTEHLDVARTKRPETWAELKAIISSLTKDHGEYRTLVIDTVDWAQRLAVAELCGRQGQDGIEGFGYGKGYTYLAEEFGQLLDALSELRDAGMTIVLLAHAGMRKIELPEEEGAFDKWEMKLEKKVSPLVKEWCDMLLFARFRTLVRVDEKTHKAKAFGAERVMETTSAATWDAKNRHGLQYQLPFEYAAIAHVITGSAIQSQASPVAVVVPSPAPQLPQVAPVGSTPHDKLRALLAMDAISEDEFMDTLIAYKYYPANTPFTALDDETIMARIIPNWAKTAGAVLQRRTQGAAA